MNDQKSYTYSEVASMSFAMMKELEDCGIKKGDIAAVLLNNCAEFAVITFALSMIGAVKAAIHTALHENELEGIINDTKADFVLTAGTESSRFDLKDVCQTSLSSSINIWKITDAAEADKFELIKTIRKDVLKTDTKPGDIRVENGDGNGVADIFYTSGSSGKTKGVPLIHDKLWRSVFSNCLNRGFAEDRVILIPLPLFHVYGYIEGLLAAAMTGGRIILENKFDIDRTFELIEKYRADDILTVPSIMLKMLNHPSLGSYDLESLKAVYCSATFAPEWIWEKIREILGVEEIITGYGMTEVYGASAQTDPEDDFETLKSKVGRPLFAGPAGSRELDGRLIEYKVIDPETELEVPAGEEGEMICRGITVMDGYINHPGKEHEAWKGWMYTGDVGTIDERGYIDFKGRMGDSYKFNGENVSINHVEKVISKMWGIRNVVVVPLKAAKYGEVGIAFAEVRRNSSISEEDIMEYAKKTLARFQVPAEIVILDGDEWPLKETGKISRRELKKTAEKRYGGKYVQFSSDQT